MTVHHTYKCDICPAWAEGSNRDIAMRSDIPDKWAEISFYMRGKRHSDNMRLLCPTCFGKFLEAAAGFFVRPTT